METVIESFFTAFYYPPIRRGVIIALIAGIVFPLPGVFIVRMNLITMRFMLMHGALLGGAIALWLSVNPLWIGLLTNALFLLLVILVAGRTGFQFGYLTSFFMVFSIALAFLIIYKANVPAKDTLELLWGNIYALTYVDSFATISFAVSILAIFFIFYYAVSSVLFDRDIAFTTGINQEILYNGILIVTGFTITFGMRLLGALLLDALIILPAISAGLFARSLKELFRFSSLIGGVSVVLGIFLSLGLDLPLSSAIAISATAIFIYGFITNRRRD